jgi:hypothetical protein
MISIWEFFIKSIVLFNASYFHIDRIITVYQIGGISLNKMYSDFKIKY